MTYYQISSLLYSVFRNGVAHSFIPQGAAILTSDLNASNRHLTFFHSGLCVYVPTLAKDVKEGIEELDKEIKQDQAFKKRYYSVLEKLEQIGKVEYQKFIKKYKIKTEGGNFTPDIEINKH